MNISLVKNNRCITLHSLSMKTGLFPKQFYLKVNTNINNYIMTTQSVEIVKYKKANMEGNMNLRIFSLQVGYSIFMFVLEILIPLLMLLPIFNPILH